MKNIKVNKFKSKLYEFVNLFVPERIELKSKERYSYGIDDCLPQDIIKIIYESGTATSCVNKLSQFIEADGFVDETAANFKVNKEQTADELLSMIAGQMPFFNGFSLYIKRSADGNVAEVEIVEFDKLRKKINGDLVYNKNMGSKDFKESENIIYPSFKGTQITTQQLAEQIAIYGNVGEVLYVYKKKVNQFIYPVPAWYSGVEDVKTDAELSKFDYETTVNGFLPSAILTIVGEVDDKTKDDKGKTDQDYLDETLTSFTGGKKDKYGLSGRAKLAVLSAKTKEEVPVLQTFDIKSIMDAASGSTDRIARKVSRLFEMPPFLIGLESATGFNTKILVDQIDLLNKSVNNYQRMISDTMKKLFPTMEWDISTFNPLSFIPDKVWDKLTDDEIRNIAGFAPKEIKEDVNTENPV